MLVDQFGRPLEFSAPEPKGTVSITRSFSMKLNLGNYESADFFCSERAECAPEDVEEISRGLDEFCKDQVSEAIRDFKERRARKEAQRAGRTAA